VNMLDLYVSERVKELTQGQQTRPPSSRQRAGLPGGVGTMKLPDLK